MHVFICSSHDINHVQVWVQVLEEMSSSEDYQPVLVEGNALTNTGGIFVLTKVCTGPHTTYTIQYNNLILHVYIRTYVL